MLWLICNINLLRPDEGVQPKIEQDISTAQKKRRAVNSRNKAIIVCDKTSTTKIYLFVIVCTLPFLQQCVLVDHVLT